MDPDMMLSDMYARQLSGGSTEAWPKISMRMRLTREMWRLFVHEAAATTAEGVQKRANVSSASHHNRPRLPGDITL